MDVFRHSLKSLRVKNAYLGKSLLPDANGMADAVCVVTSAVLSSWLSRNGTITAGPVAYPRDRLESDATLGMSVTERVCKLAE